jgi:hypothetical protein
MASVLFDSIKAAIDGRPVRHAVFTTFSFDPGFFELHVLPALFSQAFSQVDKVRRVQLEDALRECSVSVYYDRSALTQDAEPAMLPFRRIDVRRSTGCFHPKLLFALVDNPIENDEEGPPLQSLVVATLSANLTRSGWWENVEVGHVEEVPDLDLALEQTSSPRLSYRADLLGLIRQLRKTEAEGPHADLEPIHEFLRRNAPRREMTQHAYGDQWYTRLWYGQEPLAAWLLELRLHRRDWNLEIISPYFDEGEARALHDLLEALEPLKTRIALPRSPEGDVLISPELFDDVLQCEHDVHWADLPRELVGRGKGRGGDKLLDRRVHAKLYRFWHKDGRDVIVVGSPNLTRAAHGRARHGNLEAAFLVDVSEQSLPRRWWLAAIDEDDPSFAAIQPKEDEDAQAAPLEVSMLYDWRTGALSCRLEAGDAATIDVLNTMGDILFTLSLEPGDWRSCSAEQAVRVRDLLPTTSLVTLRRDDTEWRILVREEGGIGYRPSLIADWTPEEILLYWSLLSPDQRAQFLEDKLQAESELEGLAVAPHGRLQALDTLFDRFAGIYHAFGHLRRHIDEALEDGRDAQAEARLYGVKYDSLPVLLDKIWEHRERDPVTAYIEYLCAAQLAAHVDESWPDVAAAAGERRQQLNAQLDRIAELREQLALDDKDGDEFLAWLEEHFLHSATVDADTR